jgi:Cys-rich protein (TIGR01571 family)
MFPPTLHWTTKKIIDGWIWLIFVPSCTSAQNGQNRIMTKSSHVLPGMLFIVRTCPLILTAATNCTIGIIYVKAETKQWIVLLESYMSKLKRNNELYYWNHIVSAVTYMLPIVQFVAAVRIRGHVRTMKSIPGSTCRDFVIILFCPFCALIPV